MNPLEPFDPKTHFRCALCLGVFPYVEEGEDEWSDEDARKESEKLFGEEVTDQTHVVVCDDCWKTFGLDQDPSSQ